MKTSEKRKTMEEIAKAFRDQHAIVLFGKLDNDLNWGEKILLEQYIHDLRHPKWKQVIINGNKTEYYVSNTGLVKTSTGHICSKYLDRDGYEKVGIHPYSAKLVHRLVAEAFIPNPDHKETVNHMNANKQLNWVGNLEWNTMKENFDHARKLGLESHIGVKGENNNNNVYSEETIRKVCKMLEDPKNTPKMIENATGVNTGVIYDIRMKYSWVDVSKDYNIKFINYRGEGENSNLAVYTSKQIHEVCRLLQYPDNNPSKIAKMTNVDKCTVQAIRLGKVWKCISQNYVFPDIDYTKGEGKVNSKFTDDDIKKVCELLEDKYNSYNDISNITNVPLSTISKISDRKQWTHISCKYNIPKRANRKTDFIIDEYKKGKSNSEIYDVLVKEFGESGDRRHMMLQICDVLRRYKSKVESSTTK